MGDEIPQPRGLARCKKCGRVAPLSELIGTVQNKEGSYCCGRGGCRKK